MTPIAAFWLGMFAGTFLTLLVSFTVATFLWLPKILAKGQELEEARHREIMNAHRAAGMIAGFPGGAGPGPLYVEPPPVCYWITGEAATAGAPSCGKPATHVVGPGTVLEGMRLCEEHFNENEKMGTRGETNAEIVERLEKGKKH